MASFAVSAPAQAVDTTAVYRQARRAESAYDASVRQYAPVLFAAPGGGECDEIVGRYCLYYDTGRDTLPPEPIEIGVRRDSAIAALQRAFELAPGRNVFAFPLVRLLIEDIRTADAVEIARADARARIGTAEAHMLLGYALHADRQTRAALREFDRWLAILPPKEQERLTDLSWLLDDADRRAYRRMTQSQRTGYAERAWRFADPLYITEGNELRADHFARHALARTLDERGYVHGESWGSDSEQLMVRFGMPVRTTRSWRSGSMGMHYQYSDHWDPSARTYFPPSIRRALATEARLDSIWPLDTLTSRSIHAPPTLRMMRVLEGQLVAFADEARFYGITQTDSPVKSVSAALFLLDSALNVTTRAPLQAGVVQDSTTVRGAVPLSFDAQFYSAEVYDPASRFGARARYRLERPDRAGPLVLSGILLAEPFEPGRLPDGRDSPLLRPLLRLVIPAVQRLGVYTEIRNDGAERIAAQVEIEVRGLDRTSAVGRAAGWIGERLGIASRRNPTQLGWIVELEPQGVTPMPVTLDLGTLKPGAYRISMVVRNSAGGEDVVAKRDFRVITSKASSSRRP